MTQSMHLNFLARMLVLLSRINRAANINVVLLLTISLVGTNGYCHIINITNTLNLNQMTLIMETTHTFSEYKLIFLHGVKTQSCHLSKAHYENLKTYTNIVSHLIVILIWCETRSGFTLPQISAYTFFYSVMGHTRLVNYLDSTKLSSGFQILIAHTVRVINHQVQVTHHTKTCITMPLWLPFSLCTLNYFCYRSFKQPFFIFLNCFPVINIYRKCEVWGSHGGG